MSGRLNSEIDRLREGRQWEAPVVEGEWGERDSEGGGG